MAGVFAGIILLLLVLILLIRIPSFQNYVTGKLVNIIERETGAEVNLERILIVFPETVSLRNLYVSDVNDDTLVYAGDMSANIHLWKLLWNKIHISNFSLRNSTIRLIRGRSDGLYNFQYILDSLSGDEATEPSSDSSTGVPEILVGKVGLKNIRFLYSDEPGGMVLQNHTGSLDIEMDSLDIENLVFQVGRLEYKNSRTNLSIQEGVPAEPDTSDAPEASGQMPEIRAREMQLADIRFTLENKTSSGEQDSLGFNRLDIRNLFLNVINLNFTDELISVDGMELSLPDTTNVRVSGKITGLLSGGEPYADIRLEEFITDSSDIFRLLSGIVIPDGIEVPSWIVIKGSYSGWVKDMETHLDMRSGMGSLMADLHLRWNESEIPLYSGSIVIDTFDAGRFLNDSAMFGKFGIKADFTGEHFDPALMDSRVNLEIPFFDLNGYRYINTVMDVRAMKGKYELAGSMDDGNADLSLEGSHIQGNGLPETNLILDLKAANLQRLNWSEEDIRIKGMLEADLQGAVADELRGRLTMRDLTIFNDTRSYPADSLVIIAYNDTIGTDIRFMSGIMDARLKANRAFSGLTTSLAAYFSGYFDIDGKEGGNADTSFRMDFSAEIKSSPLLKEVLIPGLQAFEPGQITARFRRGRMDLEAGIPLVNYDGNEIRGLSLSAHADTGTLTGDLLISYIGVAGMYADSLRLTGRTRQDSLFAKLTVGSDENNPKYRVAGSIRFLDHAVRISFPDDRLILDYNTWTVSEDNHILLGDFPAEFSNLVFRHGSQSVAVRTDTGALVFELEKFQLDNFGNLLESPSGIPLLNGEANGKVKITGQEGESFLNADLTVDSMEVMGVHIGDMDILLKQEKPEFLTADVAVTGSNSFTIDIVRLPLDPGLRADMQISIEKLQLAMAEPYLQQRADSLTGYLQGSLHVTDRLANPSISGELSFHDAGVVIPSVGSKLSIPETTVKVTDNDLHFSNFILIDRQKNKITLNGTVKTDSLRTFKLDLNVKADNFTAINQPEKNNSIVFGRFTFSTDTDIKGLATQPEIRSRVVIKEETDLKLSIERLKPTTVEARGIVEFVDMDRGVDSILIDEKAGTLAFDPAGIDLVANIEIMPGAYFELVIDEKAGDRLRIHGSSDLSLSIDETGDLTLTGRYDVKGGSYRMLLFGFNRKEFEIQEASYILWTGRPLEAAMEVNAVYHVRAAPINLVKYQSSDANSPELSKYRQKIPFRVNLMIRGDLLTPDISFSIELPPDMRNIFQGTIRQKLQQLHQPGNESSLNKQVLSLLVFNQFMPQNPMEMEGGGISSTARQSASKLLSKQLNTFADKYVKGVDLSFDLRSYEDYSSGEAPEGRTELGMTLSRSFLNDRLEVRVGGSLELESEEHREKTNFNDVAGDIELIYDLTENGIYRVKAFRLNNYDQFEGNIVESGASLIFTRRFDRLYELFKAMEKQKKEEGGSHEK